MPRTVARTGAIGNFFFIAQWFPKLGVLQDDGWNCHQFHSSTEFFSDYGVYDVRLTVPKAWPVGATGVDARSPRQRRRHDDAPLLPGRCPRLRVDDEPRLPRADGALRAPDAAAGRDAPAAAARAREPGRAPLRGDARRAQVLRRVVRRLPVRSHHHRRSGVPERRRRHGIPDALHGRHPLACARRIPTTPRTSSIHEAGHQFWYGIVGSNEFEDAWMDEGLNTFRRSARVMGRGSPPTYLSAALFRRLHPVRVQGRPSATAKSTGTGSRATGAARRSISQSTPSYQYYPGLGSVITYNKTALWLNTIERWLGWPTVQRTLSTLLRALAVQASETARTSSTSRTRWPGAI